MSEIKKVEQDFVVNPSLGRLIKVGSSRYKTLASLGVFTQKKVAKFSVNAKTQWEQELSDFIDIQSKIEPDHNVIKPSSKKSKRLQSKPLPPTPVSSTESESTETDCSESD